MAICRLRPELRRPTRCCVRRRPVPVEITCSCPTRMIIAVLVLVVTVTTAPGDENNLAAGILGGRAEAIANSAGIHRAIDGDEALDGPDRAWSFAGRLDDAWALFALGGNGAVVRSVRMVPGVKGRSDARVAAMRLWATDVASPSLPSAWYDDPRTRIPEHHGWRQIFSSTERLQSQQGGAVKQATIYNGRVFLGGESDVQVCFDPVSASAILIKIDGAINEEHRDKPDKTHLHDHTDASIAEFQVLSLCRGAADESALLDVSTSGVRQDYAREVGEEMIEGIELQSLLTPFNRGSWFHPDRTIPAFSSCAPSSRWHSLRAKEHVPVQLDSTEGVISEDDEEWRDLESACQDISGLELVFVGDARMRHAFLATAAFFRPAGFLRGYVNRHVASRHGVFSADVRRSCGSSAQCRSADTDAEELNQAAGASSLEKSEASSWEKSEAEAEGACSAAYVPFEMELPCAGASPWQFRSRSSFSSSSSSFSSSATPESSSWELGVCGDRAVLRLVEASDASVLSASLESILQERAMCEHNVTPPREEGQACYEATVILVSTPIPTLARADFRQLEPVTLPASFVDDSLRFAQEIATMGARLATRGPSADNGDWRAAATQRATALVYSTLEPFSLIPAHHAELNRQVALVNADTRLLLRRARIPVLDSHALMVGRSGCSADGAHWAGLAQRPRVRLLLSVGARISRHVRLQKSATQPASVVSVGERMKQLRRAMVEVLRDLFCKVSINEDFS